MEPLFVVATLGVIIPVYFEWVLGHLLYCYENAGHCRKRMLYRKVKLDIEFDTENLVFKNVTSKQLPKNTLIRYEIDGVIYKEIIRLEGDKNDVFRFRSYRTTTDEDVSNWTYYDANGLEYKFNTFSYEFV